MKYLITGGAGFIGSALIRHLISSTNHQVLNIDCLTYAGNLDSLATISSFNNYSHAHTNICDREEVSQLFSDFQPDGSTPSRTALVPINPTHPCMNNLRALSFASCRPRGLVVRPTSDIHRSSDTQKLSM